MDEFIKLLDKTKVDPDIIVNDNVRSKLLTYKRTRDLDDDDNHDEEVDLQPDASHESENEESLRRNQPRINLDDILHGSGRRKK